MTNTRLSLLHIEDDSLWQTVLTAALHGVSTVSHLEHAATGHDGFALAESLRPDIILLDLRLPDIDGVSLARELACLRHPPRLLLLSGRRDAAVLYAASGPHIAGLLWKSGDTLSHLPIAIDTVARGGKYYPPEVREALRRFRADANAFFKILSARELELLPHFGQGATDSEIAEALGVSAHTVRSHRQSIMRKLGLSNTARLIHWIIANGFASSTSSTSSA